MSTTHERRRVSLTWVCTWPSMPVPVGEQMEGGTLKLCWTGCAVRPEGMPHNSQKSAQGDMQPPCIWCRCCWIEERSSHRPQSPMRTHPSWMHCWMELAAAKGSVLPRDRDTSRTPPQESCQQLMGLLPADLLELVLDYNWRTKVFAQVTDIAFGTFRADMSNSICLQTSAAW